jgi:hypothetical protein
LVSTHEERKEEPMGCRKFEGIARWTVCLCIGTVLLSSGLVWGDSWLGDRLRLDIQGDAKYTHLNYTDLVRPYNEIDAWSELKLSLFLDEGLSFGPYMSLIGSWTTDDKFWWQRNASLAAGLQYYPFTGLDSGGFPTAVIRGLRLYGFFAGREYSSEGDDDAQQWDQRVGLDLYNDNLFSDPTSSDPKLTYAIYGNTGYRQTNWASSDYDAWVTEGNAKVGVTLRDLSPLWVFGYGFADVVSVPELDERWWENKLIGGVGISIYPGAGFGQGADSGFVSDLLKRFNVYVEYAADVVWLEHQAPDSVDHWDVRAGFSFSTGGFYRDSVYSPDDVR